MIYDVSHRTTFSYASNVTISQHFLHLKPRDTSQQSVGQHALIINPAPTVNRAGRDYFGNPTNYLTVEEPHDRLTIVSNSRVSVSNREMPPVSDSPSWEELAGLVMAAATAEAQEAVQYVFNSPFTRSRLASEYAKPSFPPGRPVLEASVDLMSRIFRDFSYVSGVTDVTTPVDQVMTERRGVCQDFAHLQIACLRAMGVPARYVSGYLRTHPPEGQPRRIGADASHAWLGVWSPSHGWVDLDPTNDLLPGDEHITIAYGRDYGDVSPINGIVLGGGNQDIAVAVDVAPVEA